MAEGKSKSLAILTIKKERKNICIVLPLMLHKASWMVFYQYQLRIYYSPNDAQPTCHSNLYCYAPLKSSTPVELDSH